MHCYNFYGNCPSKMVDEVLERMINILIKNELLYSILCSFRLIRESCQLSQINLNVFIQHFLQYTLFQSSLTENHDLNIYNILTSSCLIVTFSRFKLDDNIVAFCKYAIEVGRDHFTFTSPTIPAGTETQTCNLWVTSLTLKPLGHDSQQAAEICIVLYVTLHQYTVLMQMKMDTHIYLLKGLQL